MYRLSSLFLISLTPLDSFTFSSYILITAAHIVFHISSVAIIILLLCVINRLSVYFVSDDLFGGRDFGDVAITFRTRSIRPGTLAGREGEVMS